VAALYYDIAFLAAAERKFIARARHQDNSGKAPHDDLCTYAFVVTLSKSESYLIENVISE
jgi:hypothetical protein